MTVLFDMLVRGVKTGFASVQGILRKDCRYTVTKE